MERFSFLILLIAMLGLHGAIGAAEKVTPAKVCVGKNKCVGSAWPIRSIEREYGIQGKSTEPEEMVKQLCLLQNGIYLRLQYNLRSTYGRQRPAAMDVASNAPPEGCVAIPVKGPVFDLRPIALGQSEAEVNRVFGKPDEVWTYGKSAHGILAGERGLVYGGADNAFVLVVVREGLVVRVAASVMP